MTENRAQYDAGAIAELQSNLRILRSRVEALGSLSDVAIDKACDLARENERLRHQLAMTQDDLARALKRLES